MTFTASHHDFLSAAETAALRMTGVAGSCWYLDGFKGDAVFLKLDLDPSVVDWPDHLTAEFDFQTNGQEIRISIFSRSDTSLQLFDDFTQHLAELLPKGDA